MVDRSGCFGRIVNSDNVCEIALRENEINNGIMGKVKRMTLEDITSESAEAIITEKTDLSNFSHNEETGSNGNSSNNSNSVIWVEEHKLCSLISLPIYFDLSKYLEPKNEDGNLYASTDSVGNSISRVYILFDESSLNIAIDLSSLCGKYENMIPLLIYEQYHYWSLHFIYEKSKLIKKNIESNGFIDIMEELKTCTNENVEEVVAYTSIFNSAFSKNEEVRKTLVKLENVRLLGGITSGNSKNTLNKSEIEKVGNQFVNNTTDDPKKIEWFRLHIGISKVGEYGEKKNENKKNKSEPKRNFVNSYKLRRPTYSYKRNQICCFHPVSSVNSILQKSNNINGTTKKTKKNDMNVLCSTHQTLEDISTKCDMEKKKKKETENHKKDNKNYINESTLASENTEEDTENEEYSKIKNLRTRRRTYVYFDDSSDQTVDDDYDDELSSSSSDSSTASCTQYGHKQEKDDIKDGKNTKQKPIVNRKRKNEINENNGITKKRSIAKMTTLEKVNSNESDKQENSYDNSLTYNMKNHNSSFQMKTVLKNKTNKSVTMLKNTKQGDSISEHMDCTHTGSMENENLLVSFKELFSNDSNGMYRQGSSYVHIPNANSEIYINRILRNIMNRKTSVLNTVSKNFERIESFYKGDFFVFMEEETETNDITNRNFFKSENSVFLFDATQENRSYEMQVENIKSRNKKKKKGEREETENLNNLWNFFCRNFMNEKDNQVMQVQETVDNPQINTRNNFINMLNRETLFYAMNKKNNIRKRIKEGDRLYIKFNNVYEEYDKLNILKKETVIQILIFLTKNNRNLMLTDISTYSPAFFWNIALHFNQGRTNIEHYLEKIYRSLNSEEQKNENEDTTAASKNCKKYDTQKTMGKTENEREKSTSKTAHMNVLEKKDSVSFLGSFLRYVNNKKKEKIQLAKKKFDEKFKIKRKLNKLSREELIRLFIDKDAEVNVYPLCMLKESNRLYIYEENLKKRMFACIKIVYTNNKGRCVCAASDIGKYDFICEYVGELLPGAEARKREEMYMKTNRKESYMYYFKSGEKTYCIDSTDEYIAALEQNSDKVRCLRSFARLVNHSRKNANLVAKVIHVDSKPRLIFIASRDIKDGEELLVDYGERDKDVIRQNKWLKL